MDLSLRCHLTPTILPVGSRAGNVPTVSPDTVDLQGSTVSLGPSQQGAELLKRSTPISKIMNEVRALEVRALSDEAWNEFTANAPEGIDYVAEASVRGLMVARIRHALSRGEVDRRALREHALNGL